MQYLSELQVPLNEFSFFLFDPQFMRLTIMKALLQIRSHPVLIVGHEKWLVK